MVLVSEHLRRRPRRRKRWRGQETGQALIEYAFILVLVAVVAVIALSSLGAAVSNTFQNITCNIDQESDCDNPATDGSTGGGGSPSDSGSPGSTGGGGSPSDSSSPSDTGAGSGTDTGSSGGTDTGSGTGTGGTSPTGPLDPSGPSGTGGTGPIGPTGPTGPGDSGGGGGGGASDGTTPTPLPTSTPIPTATPMPTATPTPCVTVESINSRFNSTSISAGRRIWFNSHVDVSGTIAEPVTIYVTDQTVVFSASGNSYSLDVPDAAITLDPAATEATTTFDSDSGHWVTTVPTGLSGSIFLSGLSYPVPSGGLPKNINPVSWSATFTASAPGVSLDWAWAAAVYSSFGTDYNALGVKPVDSKTASSYNNTHKAGTPENYLSSVKSGATGGGSTNYTGSDSNTASISFCG